MASTDAKLVPTKNAAYRVTFPILDADGDLVTGATGLDSEVSKDGGTFADCTNEATEIATSSGIYYLDLTATEMNADTVCVIVKTSSSGAKTTVLTFYPQEAGDLVAAVGAGGITADSLDATVQARLGIVAYGTAQAATSTSLQLASASTFANDELNGSVVVITGGTTGVGQSRVITDYVGSTDTATVDAWTTTPTGTITYVVFAAPPASATALPAVNVTQVAGTSQTAGDLAALITTVDGVVDDILTDTGTTLPATLGSPAGASLAADIAAIEAQTDDIGVAGAGLTALASAANLAIVAGYLDTEIAAIKAKTDALPASPAAVGSAMTLAADAVSADALSAAAVDKILDEVVEGQGSITLRQSLMAILAFAAGQASGGGTTECVFESPNGGATRITMTVNSAGDRSSVVLNFS